jgi:hypothetical protein
MIGMGGRIRARLIFLAVAALLAAAAPAFAQPAKTLKIGVTLASLLLMDREHRRLAARL